MRLCYRYARNKEEATELLNLAFVQLIRKLDKYDRTASFEPWMKRLAVNVILDEFRRRKAYRARITLTDDERWLEEASPSEVSEAEAQLEAADVMACLQQLPPLERTIVNLALIDGYSHAEIAAQLNLSEGASRWHLHSARKTLRKLLSEHSELYTPQPLTSHGTSARV